MQTKTVAIGPALSFGWQAFKSNVGFCITLLVLFVAVPTFFTFIMISLASRSTGALFLVELVYVIALLLLELGAYGAVLHMARGERGSWAQFKAAFSRFWPFLGASVVVGIIYTILVSIMAGVFLSAVVSILVNGLSAEAIGDPTTVQFGDLFGAVGMGGLLAALLALLVMWYLGLRLNYYIFAVVDGDGALASLSRSWNITKGVVFKLFLFSIVCFLVNMVGMMLLGVGLLVTAPVTMIAMGYTYSQLKQATPATS